METYVDIELFILGLAQQIKEQLEDKLLVERGVMSWVDLKEDDKNVIC